MAVGIKSPGSRPGWMAGLQTEPHRLFVISSISRAFFKSRILAARAIRVVSPDSAGAQGRQANEVGIS